MAGIQHLPSTCEGATLRLAQNLIASMLQRNSTDFCCTANACDFMVQNGDDLITFEVKYLDNAAMATYLAGQAQFGCLTSFLFVHLAIVIASRSSRRIRDIHPDRLIRRPTLLAKPKACGHLPSLPTSEVASRSPALASVRTFLVEASLGTK